MKRVVLFTLAWLLLGAILYFVFFEYNYDQHQLEEDLNKALLSYQKGENGKSVAERKQGFNAALDSYTQLEKKYKPCYGTGKLYYNLANTYFQLGEYPTAILYYYRAYNLMPRDPEVQHNLDTALEKLHLTKVESVSPIKSLFFFHTYFSLPERLIIFFYLGLALLVLFSMWIWFPAIKFLLKYAIILICIGYFLLFLSLLYSRYIEPLEGVLVKSSFLYRDKGKQYAKVLDSPSLAGLKVQILDVQAKGAWLKILTPDGTLGYVPAESLRLISCE